jgi:hypothetical protein
MSNQGGVALLGLFPLGDGRCAPTRLKTTASVLEHSSRSFTKLLAPILSSDSQVRSWDLMYSYPGWICFFTGVTQRASQMAATKTLVKPRLFNSLTRLAKADIMGISTSTGSSTQILLYSGSQPRKGGRIGSWFS